MPLGSYAWPTGLLEVCLVLHDRDVNDLLNFASYQVITKYEQVTGAKPSGLFFNKVLSVLNRDLGAVHLQLRLPHCWYRWGDEVVRILMPRHLQWVHEDPPR